MGVVHIDERCAREKEGKKVSYVRHSEPNESSVVCLSVDRDRCTAGAGSAYVPRTTTAAQ